MSTLSSSACMLSIPGAFPFCRCFIALYFASAGFRCIYFLNLFWRFYFNYVYRVARVLSFKYLIKVFILPLGFAFFSIKDVTAFVLYCCALPWSIVTQHFSRGIQNLYVLLPSSIFRFICNIVGLLSSIHSNLTFNFSVFLSVFILPSLFLSL